MPACANYTKALKKNSKMTSVVHRILPTLLYKQQKVSKFRHLHVSSPGSFVILSFCFLGFCFKYLETVFCLTISMGEEKSHQPTKWKRRQSRLGSRAKSCFCPVLLLQFQITAAYSDSCMGSSSPVLPFLPHASQSNIHQSLFSNFS